MGAKAISGTRSGSRSFYKTGLDPSFVPPPEIRRLRELLRYRVSLLEQRNQVHHKIRDLFEIANLKLSSVATDLLGVTGQNIIPALIAGETSADRLSWKVRGRLRQKEKQVRQAMVGCFDEFHREMRRLLWAQYRFLCAQMQQVEAKTRDAMQPHQELIALLDEAPGMNEVVAWTVIAELGTEMSVFPTAAHVCSWAGLCPGTKESAGKQISSSTRKGNRYLRRGLLQAAWAATNDKSTYLRVFFHRVKGRKGWGKAIVALAHKLLVIAYEILKTKTRYYEFGPEYYDQLNPERTVKRLVQRLTRLGFQVELEAQLPAPVSADQVQA